MARRRWLQQMNEIGLLPPAVDLTRIMEEVEFEPPNQAGGGGGYSTSTSALTHTGADVPRPLANKPALAPATTQLALNTSFLDSTLRVFLDYHDMCTPDAGGDLPPRASDSDEDEDENENEDTTPTSEAANPATATRSSVQFDSSHSTDARRKRKRTDDAQDAAPLFAPSANSKRSRSNGTLLPAHPCARCIEKDLECRICYVGGACNACRARGRKCDLVDPETKHTHTGSIATNLLKRHDGRTFSNIHPLSLTAAHAGGKNSKAPAGKLILRL